jgi:diaminopimelate decarboxylase
MSTAYPKLTPIVHPWIKDITSHVHLLNRWMDQYGSPVNIHNLISFGQNYLRFDRLFHKYGVTSKVFFARKANKCKCFVWAAKEYGFGVDTASLNEIKECIQAGINPDKITITAAVKTTELLNFAVDHQIPVVLDNEDECVLLQRILTEKNTTLAVGFRISGFAYQDKKLYSRFGFDIDELAEFLKINLHSTGRFNRFHYKGLHFHLSGYSTEERIAALSQTLDLATIISKDNFNTTFIDMGGGILMNYLESASEWDAFHHALKNSLLPENKEITFRKDPLGLIQHDNQILGEAKVYPYYNELHQERFVEKIITGLKNGVPLYHHLKEKKIELRIEPGRSLLDQCGITIARVAFRKKDAEGRNLIGLEMNRTQMFSSSADYLLDPIFIPKVKKDTESCEVYFVGAYCLEQELILKRKISLPQFPEIGELICFVNTAGYMMHFYESEAHLFELAQNLVVEKIDEWQIFEDKDYISDEALAM